MTLRRAAWVVVLAAAAAAVGYWLFSDTVEHYSAVDEAAPLRISFWGDYEEYKMWQGLLAAWDKKHPDMPVRAEYILNRYEAKIQQLLVADAAPDVMLFQDEPLPGFVRSGKFEDLTPFLKRSPGGLAALKKYWPTAVDSFGHWEGHGAGRKRLQYGMPIWGGCNLIFYNVKAFQRVGLRVGKLPGPAGLVRGPGGKGWIVDDNRWTIPEFVHVCQIATRDFDHDGRIDQFGFLLPGDIYWLPWTWSMGGHILDATRTHTVFYGPAIEASLRLWQDLRFKYHVSPSPAELGTMGQNVGFLTGRLAMFCSGPWAMPFLNATGMKYGVLHIPRGPGGVRATRITWDGLVMFAGSKKKKEAWQLIQHLLCQSSQELVDRYQRSIPALRSAAGAFIHDNPRVDVSKFVQAADEYSRLQPISPYWQMMVRTWDDAMSELANEDASERLTPAQAIGCFLSDRQLMQVLPPADPAEARRYREIYRRHEEGS